jgi:hypothetical protein
MAVQGCPFTCIKFHVKGYLRTCKLHKLFCCKTNKATTGAVHSATGVWSPALLHSSGSGPTGVAKALSNDMQVVQFMFLRMLAGRVRKSTCRQLLLREFGCQPLVSAWFTACWSLWDRVVSRPPGDWLFLAMQENRDLSMRAFSRPADQRTEVSVALSVSNVYSHLACPLRHPGGCT